MADALVPGAFGTVRYKDMGDGTVAEVVSTVVAATSFSFVYLSAAGTTQQKTGAGVLHTVSVDAAGDATSTISIYDATSGTTAPIAVIDTGVAGPKTMVFDAAFANGLRIIIASTTTAPKVTITYS